MKHLSLALLMFAGSLTASAQIFDTSAPDSFIGYGARIGVNTSSSSRDNKYSDVTIDKWGTGFDIGAVVDLNIMRSLSIQPGFFFESRSQDYTYLDLPENYGSYFNLTGHARQYTFKIPVVASAHFFPIDALAVSVDFGPYFTIGLGGSDKGEYTTTEPLMSMPFSRSPYETRNRCEFGLRMGVGFEVLYNYYLGIHYDAGCTDVWKNYGGRSKTWVFTLGYNF